MGAAFIDAPVRRQEALPFFLQKENGIGQKAHAV
jgi:hypothetical protein